MKLEYTTATEALPAANLLRRLQRPAAQEDRHAAQHRLLVFGQQVVAPIHQRPQRPVTGQCAARSADEKAKALVEACAQFLHREQAYLHGRELDRQCDAIQAAADRRKRRGVLLRDLEARLLQPCAVGEQALRFGHRQRRHSVRRLPGDAQSLAAGREDREIAALHEQSVGKRRGRLEQVLGVVQHQQL